MGRFYWNLVKALKYCVKISDYENQWIATAMTQSLLDVLVNMRNSAKMYSYTMSLQYEWSLKGDSSNPIYEWKVSF